MLRTLLERRDQEIQKADLALDLSPTGNDADVRVHQLEQSLEVLRTIVLCLAAIDAPTLEQSRTRRQIGRLLFHLSLSGKHDVLAAAHQELKTAASLLGSHPEDRLEAAKVHFNLAQVLAQLGSTTPSLFDEARQEAQVGRAGFAATAPELVGDADALLRTIDARALLTDLQATIKRNSEDMARLQRELAHGGPVDEIARRAKALMSRDGGLPRVIGAARAVADNLPIDAGTKDAAAEAVSRLDELAQKVRKPSLNLGPDALEAETLRLLRQRLDREQQQGQVDQDEAAAHGATIDAFEQAMSHRGEDVDSLRAKGESMREVAARFLQTSRPRIQELQPWSEGARVDQLLALCGDIRAYLGEEMNRPWQGETEGREGLDLYTQVGALATRLKACADDDARVMRLEFEMMRPLALAVRAFGLRQHAMPAKPFWGSADLPMRTTAAFLSPAAAVPQDVEAALRRSGLEIEDTPQSEGFGAARWRQLQQATTVIADMRGAQEKPRAQACYELGLALALGKPVVVLVDGKKALPFDIDLPPLLLGGSHDDEDRLSAAMDHAWAWTPPHGDESAWLRTREHVLGIHGDEPRAHPHDESSTLSSLRLLDPKAPDPTLFRALLRQWVRECAGTSTTLLAPRWAPQYCRPGTRRLFHVMPFSEAWSDGVSKKVRTLCKAHGIAYQRGDDVSDPDVIRSIWQCIGEASHVLVDLTGLNPNVALEMGLVDAIGRRTLLVSQAVSPDHLFASISRVRVHEYQYRAGAGGIRMPKELADFLAT